MKLCEAGYKQGDYQLEKGHITIFLFAHIIQAMESQASLDFVCWKGCAYKTLGGHTRQQVEIVVVEPIVCTIDCKGKGTNELVCLECDTATALCCLNNYLRLNGFQPQVFLQAEEAARLIVHT